MSFATVETPGVQGTQQPRILSVAPYVSTSGDEAIELAAYAGLYVDPWQGEIVRYLLGERPDRSWAAFQAGVCVPRQNGKNGIVEVRELAGLFILGEQLIVHSAHQFDTSLEAFRRLEALIDSRDEFTRRVKKISRAHGQEGIELHGPPGRRVSGGQRIRFRTRTKSGGRGFSGDALIWDESQIIPTAFHGAVFPIMSARPNPQSLYVGTAVDQQIHEHGHVFTDIRNRGLKGDDPRLLYAEWSPDLTLEQAMDPAMSGEPDVWAEGNPALGIRITSEYIEEERKAMDARSFAVERLGVGDWPQLQTGGEKKISLEMWAPLVDRKSKVQDPVCLSFDVTPERSWASIGAAGGRKDGLGHLEVIEHRRTANWVVKRLVELTCAHKPVAIVWDGRSPAAALEAPLRTALDAVGVKLKTGDQELLIPVGAGEFGQACGMLYDGVDGHGVRHGDQPEVTAALKGATARMLGDGAWIWSRKHSGVDISPLVTLTLAWWGYQTQQPPKPLKPLVAVR